MHSILRSVSDSNFGDEQIADVLARGDANCVVEGPEVERRREDVRKAEWKHERDPSCANETARQPHSYRDSARSLAQGGTVGER